MDQELKAYLDAMQQGLAAQIEREVGSVRQDMGTTRQDLTAQIVESREHAEQLHAQAIEHAEHLHTEARILIEAVHHDVRLVAEGVMTFNQKLDRITDDHERRIQHLERKAL